MKGKLPPLVSRKLQILEKKQKELEEKLVGVRKKEKPRLQKLLQGLISSQKSIEEELKSAGISREVTLCEMAELENSLGTLIPRFTSLKCEAEAKKIKRAITDLSLEREKLTILSMQP